MKANISVKQNRDTALKTISFEMSPHPPFRLDFTVWALRREAINKVDAWDGQTYRRVLKLKDRVVQVLASQSGTTDKPLISVTLSGADIDDNSVPACREILQRMLGTDADLSGFYTLAAKDDLLNKIVQQFRGLKPPRFRSIFETLVNGIACQQVSLISGISALNRLAEAHGTSVADPGSGVIYSFPEPEDLANLKDDSLREIGFSHNKSRAIVELAHHIIRGNALEGLASLSNEQAVDVLYKLRGVGRWTAEYALLRGLGRLDIFPGDDISARNNVRRWRGIDSELDYEETQELLSGWYPYAGLIYFYLRLKHLSEEGFISSFQKRKYDMDQLVDNAP